MNQSNAVLTECEETFVVSYIQETVQLEMQGPAHSLLAANGIANVEFDVLLLAFPELARKLFVEWQRDRNHMAPLIWPWPGMTATDITDVLNARRQTASFEQVHQPPADDGQRSSTDLAEEKDN
jgi:hypothetical protein